jgi:hypothetical protein
MPLPEELWIYSSAPSDDSVRMTVYAAALEELRSPAGRLGVLDEMARLGWDRAGLDLLAEEALATHVMVARLAEKGRKAEVLV